MSLHVHQSNAVPKSLSSIVAFVVAMASAVVVFTPRLGPIASNPTCQLALVLPDRDPVDAQELVTARTDLALASLIFANVSASGLARAIDEAATCAQIPRGNQILAPADYPKIEAWNDFMRSIAQSWASTITTLTFDGARTLADEWSAAMTDQLHPGDGTTLSLLLKQAGELGEINPMFLKFVIRPVYSWELLHSVYEWGNNAGEDLTSFTQTPNGIWTSVPAWDVLANLLSSTQHTPESALDFFLGSYFLESRDKGYKTALPRLLINRAWPIDGGRAFSQALIAAAMDSRGPLDFEIWRDPIDVQRTPEFLSSALAWRVFDAIGHSDSKFKLPAELAVAVGVMVGAYAADFGETALASGRLPNSEWHVKMHWGNWGVWNPPIPLGVFLDKATAARVISALAECPDTTGYSVAVASAVAGGSESLRFILEHARSQHHEAAESVDALFAFPEVGEAWDAESAKFGGAMGLIVGVPKQQAGDDQAQARAVDDAVNRGLSVATSLGPEPGVSATQVVTGAEVDAIQETITSGSSSPGPSDMDDFDGSFQNRFEELVYNSFIQTGLLTAESSSIPPEVIQYENGMPIRIAPEAWRSEPIPGLSDEQQAAVNSAWIDWRSELNHSNSPYLAGSRQVTSAYVNVRDQYR